MKAAILLTLLLTACGKESPPPATQLICGVSCAAGVIESAYCGNTGSTPQLTVGGTCPCPAGKDVCYVGEPLPGSSK